MTTLGRGEQGAVVDEGRHTDDVSHHRAGMASLNALRADAEAWLEGLGRARAASAPGAANLALVDAAHPEVVSAENARAVGALLGSSRVPEHELPRLRILVRFLEDASLEAAAREGHSALEVSRWRSAPESGVEAPLVEAEAALALTEERPARLQREGAVNRGWEALLGTAQRVQTELAQGASALGAGSVVDLLDARRDPAWPALDLDGFLRRTEDAYREVLGWALGKVAPRLLPLARGDATLADLERVRALPGYPGALENADEGLRAWSARLPGAEERARHLRIRTVPAPAARAIAVDVPDRIELLLPEGAENADAARRFYCDGLRAAPRVGGVGRPGGAPLDGRSGGGGRVGLGGARAALARAVAAVGARSREGDGARGGANGGACGARDAAGRGGAAAASPHDGDGGPDAAATGRGGRGSLGRAARARGIGPGARPGC